MIYMIITFNWNHNLTSLRCIEKKKSVEREKNPEKSSWFLQWKVFFIFYLFIVRILVCIILMEIYNFQYLLMQFVEKYDIMGLTERKGNKII